MAIQKEANVLFRKKITRSCVYCSYSTLLSDGSVLCAKKGVLPEPKSCRKFNYDPFRRIPGKMKSPDFSQFNQDDFTL